MSRVAASGRTLTASDVFISFFCLYLITARIGPPFGDAVPMWQAAENLVRHGTLAIDVRWPSNAPLGRNGHYYPVAALLACLVHLPGALLQRVIGAEQAVAVTSLVAPLVLGALVPTLSFRLFTRLGYDLRASAATTLLVGMGTSIWVYAHQPYSEILQAACFLAFFGALLRAGEDGTRGSFLRLGLTLSLLVNAKNIYFLCLPCAAAYLYFRRRADRRAVVVGFGWVGAGLAPGLIALAAYNYVRWGSIASSGYGAVTSGFWTHNVLWGLWGQLFSPGKSLFLFSPVIVLALFGARRLVAHRSHVGTAIAVTVAPFLLVYARYQFWSGDWGWGPRYLVFALPVLVLPAAELFSAGQPWGRARRVCVAGVFAAAVGVQLVGTLMSWSPFMRVARQAQQAWLGKPDVRGTVLSPYPCFSCLEEVYGVQWLPPMQQILGQWWLARHKLAGDDWKTAEADAPWKRYTSLTLDIQSSYDQARIDHWSAALPPGRRLPAVAIVGALLAIAVPLRRWGRALRGTPRPSVQQRL